MELTEGHAGKKGRNSGREGDWKGNWSEDEGTPGPKPRTGLGERGGGAIPSARKNSLRIEKVT